MEDHYQGEFSTDDRNKIIEFAQLSIRFKLYI